MCDNETAGFIGGELGYEEWLVLCSHMVGGRFAKVAYLLRRCWPH